MRWSSLDEARLQGAREAASRLSLVSASSSGGGTTIGTLLGFFDLVTGPEASTSEVRRARVMVDGAEVPLPADPGAYVIGGLVVVEVDGTRRPVRVTGPHGPVPAPVEGQPSPVVVHRPDLVIDEPARAASEAAGQAAATAVADAAAARGWVDETGAALVADLGTLTGETLPALTQTLTDAEHALGVAFPGGAFDVQAGVAAAQAAADAAIARGDNLIMDPTFRTPAWTGSGTATDDTGYSGGWSVLLPASSSQLSRYHGGTSEHHRIQVAPGDVLRVSVQVRSNATIGVANARIYVREYATRSDTTWLPNVVWRGNAAALGANQWHLIEGDIEVRDGASWIAPGVVVQGAHNAATRFSDIRVVNITAAAEALAAAQAAALAAGDAKDRADAAMVTADGKNHITYTQVAPENAANPPAPDPDRTVDDIHRNRVQNGLIVGEWRWTGTAWEAVTFGDEVLTSLDVGKITAGTGVIQTALIELLAVDIATIIELNADRVTAGQIDVARLNAEAVAAAIASFLRVTTDMLLVGGMNLLPDPRFEDAALTEGRRSRSAGLVVSGGIQAGTAGYVYLVPSTSAANARQYAVRCTPGESYRVEVPVTGLTSALVTTYRYETWNASGTGRVLRQGTDGTLTGGVLSYVVTIPAGCHYWAPVIFRTGQTYRVDPGARVTLMADSRVIVDGAVTARAMNVVTTAAGATLRIDPDGIRLWRAGNPPASGSPNLTLTSGDGFRVQRDDGTGLLWIDPATGDLHNAGNIISGGVISGSEVIGGTLSGSEIDIATPAGIPVFSASPAGGVSIGGTIPLYARTANVTASVQQLIMSDTITVVPGRTYRCRFLVTRSAGYLPETGRVQAVWSTHVQGITAPYLPPVNGSGEAIEIDVIAPPGETALHLRWVSLDTVPGGQHIASPLASISEVAHGSVQVAGDVSASTGNIALLTAHQIQGSTGVPYDPSDTGWIPVDLAAAWVVAAGNTVMRRKRGNDAQLYGEVVKVAPGGGAWVTSLPGTFWPAQRMRGRAGWGVAGTTGDGWYEINEVGELRIYEFSRTSSPGFSLSAIPPYPTVL